MTYSTDDAQKQQEDIDAQLEQEIKEILAMMIDIRRRTGFGRVVIEIKYGEVHGMEFTFTRRPKNEKKQAP